MMRILKTILLTVFVIGLLAGTVYSSSLDLEAQYDLNQALNYAFTANIDTLVLVTDGGVYTTTDTVEMVIKEPLTIIAKPGLSQRPVITHSDTTGGVLEIFRVANSLTVEGVIFDGSHPESHGMKYALRVGENPLTGQPAANGLNVTVKDCEFYNFYQDKDPGNDGHVLYFLKDVFAGTVRFENNIVNGTGYEAIRISETEKYSTPRALDSLIVRNCTFENVDAECVRLYSDTDTTSTEDAYVLVDHLTINHCNTRAFYFKNNKNVILRDCIITNAYVGGHARNDYIAQVQLSGSIISNMDTLNIVYLTSDKKFQGTKGAYVDTTTIYAFDPLYADPENSDFTLAPNSPAYGKAFTGNALGDLRWADPAVGVKQPSLSTVPKEFELMQNYPNPFNPTTTIQYSVSTNSDVKIQIYDITGATVETLVNGVKTPGKYSVKWNAQNVATGVYFYNMTINGKIASTKKMILMR